MARNSDTLLVFTCLILVVVIVHQMGSENNEYVEERRRILKKDAYKILGASLNLSSKEEDVNRILLQRKDEELQAGYKNSSAFLPSLHFLQAKELIKNSPVFEIIRMIPKGASLHTHMTAAVSNDFIIKNFSYEKNLYGGYVNGVFKLKFMLDPKEDIAVGWQRIEDLRKADTNFDEWLKSLIGLTVEDTTGSEEDIWSKFKSTFTTIYDMISCRKIFERYIHELLQEIYDDNIMYTEVRGTIMPLYDLDGKKYSNEEFFDVFIKAVKNFKDTHPGFIGVRYIHSIYRGVDSGVLRNGLSDLIQLKNKYPDFIAGFDFVGHEEEGNSLFDYHRELLQAQKDLKFFFHAGETNWFGHTDVNLVDAILLNSFRIGHGFAIVKHPELLALARERDIPLEICPISNQVLKLNADPRNHAAASLISTGYPVVVGNDDPSVWDAVGLSYDWYIAFMAMSPRHSGIEFLKQLALNSIKYSSMNSEEKIQFKRAFEKDWDKFLDKMLISENTV